MVQPPGELFGVCSAAVHVLVPCASCCWPLLALLQRPSSPSAQVGFQMVDASVDRPNLAPLQVTCETRPDLP